MSDTDRYASRRPMPVALRFAAGLAAVALILAGYLAYVSVALGGQALGCGAGAGCSEVLTSSWSKVLGVPVGVLAVAVYGLTLACLAALGTTSSAATRRVAWGALVVLAGLILAAAVWFVALQAFVLKAFCPWCLADHAAGIVVAFLILSTAFRRIPQSVEDDSDEEDESEADGPNRHVAPFPRTASVCLAGIGLCGALFLTALQVAFPSAGPPVRRIAEAGNADTGPGPQRRIAVLGGRLELSPHELPTVGSPDAPTLLVVLFDYCCPHCRRLHGWLEVARQRYPGQFAVVLLPTPQNPRCHPGLEETEPRFEHACEISRLALAVWRADRTKFAEYDRWLFESEDPRTPEAATAKAEELVAPAALAAALEDTWIDERIQSNVSAYRQGGVDRIPVILSPGFSAIVGRPADEDVLFKILETELGLRK